MIQQTNQLYLCGTMEELPVFSHACYGQRFVRFMLAVERKSGATDRLPVLASEDLLPPVLEENCQLAVEGQLRTYTQCGNEGNHLLIAGFARSVRLSDGEPDNQVQLCGILSRPPVYRSTPLGREIADLFVGVERAFHKSDYLPVIAWGRNARLASGWNVGDPVQVTGRLQSRGYQKKLSDGAVCDRTAFEVSASSIIRVLPPPYAF